MKKKGNKKVTQNAPAIKGRTDTESSKDNAADKTVWDSSRILKILGNNSSDVVFLYNMGRRLQHVSPSFKMLTGYETASLKKKHFINYFHPDDSERLLKAWEEVFEGKEYRGKFRCVTKQNTVKMCTALWKPVCNESGRQIGVLRCEKEIIERKPVEEALRESEEKYRSILEAMEEGLYEIDLKGNYTFVNDAACRQLGYTRDEMIRMNYKKICAPETRRYLNRAFNQIFETGRPELLMDYEVIRKDGHARIFQANASLMRNASGKATGFLSLARDVTDRRRSEDRIRMSEERYRNILNTMQESYIEVDLKGNLKFFSEAVIRNLGYANEELLGMNFRKLVDGENRKKVFGAFQQVFLTGESSKGFDWEIIKKNGEKLTVESSVSIQKDEMGNAVGFRGVVRDVTQRKISEEALRRSEEKYRIILDSMKEGLYEIDLKGTYTFVNKAAAGQLGYTPEELAGMSYKSITSPETGRHLYEIFHRIYETGEPEFLMDYDVIRKDGSIRTHQSNAQLIRDSSGKPTGFRNLARDVTDRKRAEEAEKQSEEKYRNILETMEEGLFESDFNNKYTFVNDAACRLMGYERDELIGMDAHRIHPPEMIDDILKIYRKMYKTGKPEFLLDYKVIRKDGSVRIHQANALTIRNSTGEIVGFRTLARDVTERRRAEEALRQKEEALRLSEEKYRMIAENVNDVIWTIDFNMNFTYISPSIFLVTGHMPEEIQNKPVKDIMTPESFALVGKLLTEELANEKNRADPNRSRTLELELVKKNGGTIWVEASATFTRDENFNAGEILGVARDISERKRAEKEKAILEEQLLQARKMESVGRLAGGVAHDFNNMLSVILGYAELIRTQLPKGDPIMAEMMEIEKAASRSKEITSQLLAFSRKQIIAPKHMDLNGLIINTQKTLTRLIGEDIELKYYPGQNLWKVKFDASQMEQILVNLAANARDAMPFGGKLTIETENIHLNEDYCKTHLGFNPGDHVLLEVSDNGSGMDKETLEHLFEPFFTTKDIGKGTGLGLAMVYGIVTQNGGFINVYSEPGKGSIFKIYMPRSMEDGQVQEEEETMKLATGSGTVLLVEDDEMVRHMINEMLEAIGYSVLAAESPVAALSILENSETHIDLVLTDVVMPVMSGKMLRDWIEIMRPGLKVLFMSGYSSNVIVHHGVLDEGVQFIQKPFSLIDLARKVREAISNG
jgi:two-component system, cell cycle sensor histidine kinase and response regulator CckA